MTRTLTITEKPVAAAFRRYHYAAWRLANEDAMQIVAAAAAVFPDFHDSLRWMHRQARELEKALGVGERQRAVSATMSRSARRANVARMLAGHAPAGYASSKSARDTLRQACKRDGVAAPAPRLTQAESGRNGGVAGSRARWGAWEARRAEARRLREQGMPLAAIAAALGYRSESSVHYALKGKHGT